MNAPANPVFLQMEPVGQCNLRCQMCSIQFRRDGPPYGPPAFMPFDLFTHTVDEVPGLEELHLQGLGEPLMHPRFFEMVRYAVARGVRVTTNSNLTLLNERKAAELVASGLHTLHVSIDAASPEGYTEIRVRGKLERVLRNVRLVTAAKEAAGSELPHLRLVAVVMRKNVSELPALVHLARELGFESMFVQHLAHDFAEESLPEQYRPMRTFVDEQTLLGEDEERVAQEFSRARATAEELGLPLRLPPLRVRTHPAGTPGRERCDWPWRGAYLSYDGQAMPCCMVATPDRKNFGSVTSDGLLATWRGEEYEAFREALGSDEPPDVCRSCAVYRGTF